MNPSNPGITEEDKLRAREQIALARKRTLRNKNIEARVWALAAAIFLTLIFLSFFPIGPLKELDLPSRSTTTSIFFFLLLTPLVVNLIFDQLPFGLLRDTWRTLSGSYITISIPTLLSPAEYERKISQPTENKNGIETWFALASDSRNLAAKIYQRSGVYLLAGVAIAFSGLGFFYVARPTSTMAEAVEVSIWIRESIPRLGMLVFIELVAFFFLRLYRNSMDEFRHFEAITRHREETAALLQLQSEGSMKLDIGEMIKNRDFFSDSKKLNSNQTTEILESKKLERNELAILEKAIDAINRSKN